MAYEQKPGQGIIFKNEQKKADNHPDYSGNFTDPQGKKWQVALWVKEGKKGKFFSMGVSEPREQEPKREDPDSNSLPF